MKILCFDLAIFIVFVESADVLQFGLGGVLDYEHYGFSCVYRGTVREGS